MECKKKRELVKQITNCGILSYPLIGGKFSPPGWPDHYFTHKRYRGFVEFKDEFTKYEPLQQSVAKQLIAQGDEVFICRFVGNEIWRFECPLGRDENDKPSTGKNAATIGARFLPYDVKIPSDKNLWAISFFVSLETLRDFCFSQKLKAKVRQG